MKTLLTDDANKIQDELGQLIQAKARLFCVRRVKENLALGQLYALAITHAGSDDLLVLHHPHEPSCASPTCMFYYHRQGKPLRYFESVRVKKAQRYLGLMMPQEIFNIQRRRFPRVPTAPESAAVFFIKNKQRLSRCTVADVSLGGAKIVGSIPAVVSKGDVVVPLTISLFKRFASHDEIRILVPEATVVWSQVLGGETRSMGIRFSLSGEGRQALSDYIDLRAIEVRYESGAVVE